MSRVDLTIDKLVLKGFDPTDRKAIAEGLQRELTRILGDAATRGDWARSRRTPVLRLGTIPFQPGTSGGTKFGADVARAIGKRLKP
jgi:hypothetical protein